MGAAAAPALTPRPRAAALLHRRSPPQASALARPCGKCPRAAVFCPNALCGRRVLAPGPGSPPCHHPGRGVIPGLSPPALWAEATSTASVLAALKLSWPPPCSWVPLYGQLWWLTQTCLSPLSRGAACPLLPQAEGSARAARGRLWARGGCPGAWGVCRGARADLWDGELHPGVTPEQAEAGKGRWTLQGRSLTLPRRGLWTSGSDCESSSPVVAGQQQVSGDGSTRAAWPCRRRGPGQCRLGAEQGQRMSIQSPWTCGHRTAGVCSKQEEGSG